MWLKLLLCFIFDSIFQFSCPLSREKKNQFDTNTAFVTPCSRHPFANIIWLLVNTCALDIWFYRRCSTNAFNFSVFWSSFCHNTFFTFFVVVILHKTTDLHVHVHDHHLMLPPLCVLILDLGGARVFACWCRNGKNLISTFVSFYWVGKTARKKQKKLMKHTLRYFTVTYIEVSLYKIR